MSESFFLKLGEEDLGQKHRDEIAEGIRLGSIGVLHKISADGQVWTYATEHPAFGGSGPEAPAVSAVPVGGPPPMPGSSSAAEEVWYVSKDQDVLGPWTRHELLDAIDQGVVQAEHQIKSESDDQWQPIGNRFGKACRRVVRRRESQNRAQLAAQKAIPPEAKTFSLLAAASLAACCVVGPGSLCAVVLGVLAMFDVLGGRGYVKGAGAACGAIFLGGLTVIVLLQFPPYNNLW